MTEILEPENSSCLVDWLKMRLICTIVPAIKDGGLRWYVNTCVDIIPSKMRHMERASLDNGKRHCCFNSGHRVSKTTGVECMDVDVSGCERQRQLRCPQQRC